MIRKLLFTVPFLAVTLCFVISPAPAQDVWLKGNLSLWLLAPKGEGAWSRMGRDSYISFEAQLDSRRSLFASVSAFDFPNKKAGTMDQFFLTLRKGKQTVRVGRIYAPFGAEGMAKYDKYVEPNDPATVKNPFLDQFGDGIALESGLGRATLNLAALNLALDGNSSADFFARASLPLKSLTAGASVYRESGGDRNAAAADLRFDVGPVTIIGESLTGRPLGESAKANFVALYLRGSATDLFFKFGSYHPDVGPTAITRKIGLSHPALPLGTWRLWWQDNAISRDQLILDFEVAL